ncbi:MAG: Lrp/AsnC family transcriptional regulator [Pseudomonadota bacterium]
MDETDRALIGALRLDGRASVTTLAAELGLARATVKSRLAKLHENGTIRRFTIELDTRVGDELIQAVMMVEVQGNLTRSVIARLRRMPEVVSLHTTNGAWDLVARLETGTLAEFDRALRDVREINGVSNSETCLLLDRAY